MPDTAVARLPAKVIAEAKRIAGITGDTPANQLAQAWKEYVQNHREEFAADLEEAAAVLRDGDLADFAAFGNRGNEERAAELAEAAQS